MPKSLTDLDTHFRFGENWASFAQIVTPQHIARSVESLRALAGKYLPGKSFLDIGCGSGLPALAAAKLGVSRITAIDIDPMSVRTAEEMLRVHAPEVPQDIRARSVFDLHVSDIGQFDVVHSWGVLHHTGNMWPAIDKAIEFVAPGGIFILAIYLKTPFCGAWRVEKKIYTMAPRWGQEVLLALYRFAFYLKMLLTGRNPWKHATAYQTRRGMDIDHDFRDWLGGYPYESASPAEIDAFMKAHHFELVHIQNAQTPIGVLGTACAEYVYRRLPA